MMEGKNLYKQKWLMNESTNVNKIGFIVESILFFTDLGIMPDRIVEDLSMTEQARDTEALIRDQIAKHAVLLYMKAHHNSHSVVSLHVQLKHSVKLVVHLRMLTFLRIKTFVRLYRKLQTGQHSHNCGLMASSLVVATLC